MTPAAPGADGQCQAYHYHHQLPVMRSTQQGFMETKQEQDCSSVVKKSIRYVYIDYPLYPCSFLCDNIFVNVLSEIMIPIQMGQRPGPAP